MDMETELNDSGALYISKNGSSYYKVSKSDFEQNLPNYANSWKGIVPVGEWQQVFLDLFSVTNPGLAPITANDTIEVLYYFRYDNTNNDYPGWNIDDFEIYDLKDTTTTIVDPATQIPAKDIPSTIDDKYEATDVFKFTVDDVGTADGLPTQITQITIYKDGGTAEWSSSIGGAELWGENGRKLYDFKCSIYPDKLVFTAKDTFYYEVPDGTTEDLTLKLWLNKTGLVDNSTMIFKVKDFIHNNTNTHLGYSSNFRNQFPAEVVSNIITIDVEASELRFSNQPSPYAYLNQALTEQPAVVATDENGNIDMDYSGTITLSNTEGFSMLNNTATTSNDTAKYSGFQFTNGQGYVNLNASDGTIRSYVASREIAVNIPLCSIFTENFNSYATTSCLNTSGSGWLQIDYNGNTNWGIVLFLVQIKH